MYGTQWIISEEWVHECRMCAMHGNKHGNIGEINNLPAELIGKKVMIVLIEIEEEKEKKNEHEF